MPISGAVTTQRVSQRAELQYALIHMLFSLRQSIEEVLGGHPSISTILLPRMYLSTSTVQWSTSP